MKKLLLTASSIVLLSASAYAADLPSRTHAPVAPASPVLARSWTGAYVGVTVGYARLAGKVGSVGTTVSDTLSPLETLGNFDNNYNFADATASFATASKSVSSENIQLGVTAGYNYQFSNRIVAGFEADLNHLGLSVSGAANNTAYVSYDGGGSEGTDITGNIRTSASVDWLATLRGRLGVLVKPNLLVFGTAGLAFGHVKISNDASQTFSTHPGTNGEYCWEASGICDVSNSAGTFTGTGSSSTQWKVGLAIGGGLEYRLNDHLTLKGEGIYYDLGKTHVNGQLAATGAYGSGGPTGSVVTALAGSASLHGVIARVGLNYHF